MLAKRTLCFADGASIEAGQPIDPPEQKVAVAAITDNPFAGRFDRDLKPLTDARFEIGQKIFKTTVAMLVPYQLDAAARRRPSSSTAERAVAILTTAFDNAMRDAADGKAWISSISKRAAFGATIDIPLAENDAHNVRCHHDSALPHAPLPNDIATTCTFANRGRPNDRLGDLLRARSGHRRPI
jgi:hypothetical protein